MKKEVIIIVIFFAIILNAAFINFVISKSPLLNFIATFAGLVFLIVGSYFLFRNNKIFFFIVSGFIFMGARYVTFYFFSKPYPKISFFVFELLVFLGIISFGIAGFKLFKELLKK